jgi:hypothetical protein
MRCTPPSISGVVDGGVDDSCELSDSGGALEIER